MCGRVGKKLIDVECRAGGVMRPPDREYKQNTTSASCSAVTRGDTRPDGMCPRCSHHYKCGTHSTTIVSIPHIIWSLYIYILHYHRYGDMEIFYHTASIWYDMELRALLLLTLFLFIYSRYFSSVAPFLPFHMLMQNTRTEWLNKFDETVNEVSLMYVNLKIGILFLLK